MFTQIKELANEAPRAYTPSRLAVKSSQPHLVAIVRLIVWSRLTRGLLLEVSWAAKVHIISDQTNFFKHYFYFIVSPSKYSMSQVSKEKNYICTESTP